jgi:hypothetical protein
MLERYAMKVARTVLRGGSGSNATPLPDHPIPGKVRRGWRGGSLRVFRQFVWLQVGSVKVALSRPTHQRVTQAVRRHEQNPLRQQSHAIVSFHRWHY